MFFELWDAFPVLQGFWLRFLGILILAVVYKYGFIFFENTDELAQRKNEEKSLAESFISCGSPVCVRCRTYTKNSMMILCPKWSGMVEQMDATERSRVERISSTMQEYAKMDSAAPDPMYRLRGLGTKPFFDAEEFEVDTSILENNWEQIYHEYLMISGSDDGWNVNSTPRGCWSVFYFINQGKKVVANLSKCPIVNGILQELENVMSGVIFGNAGFSVIHPETHIAEHCGPCNIRVRCHLGLDVPAGCQLFVDGLQSGWQTGKCIFFDDSYLHSVVHNGSHKESRPRAVFLVDFWNPEISTSERKGLSELLSSTELEDVMENVGGTQTG